MPTPPIRVRPLNDAPVREDGAFVLYWMTSARRPIHSFSLERAVERARDLARPLVVLEALRLDYPYASDRLHRFVLQGMADHRAWFASRPVTYHPFVETEKGGGKGLLRKLATRACVVVGDDYPAFFLPRMLGKAAEVVPCRLEVVDGNGLLPLRAADRTFTVAHSFRRFLQKALPDHLGDTPSADPLEGVDLPTLPKMPRAITDAWPAAKDALLEGDAGALADLAIDHDVPPVEYDGGFRAGSDRLDAFVDRHLTSYADGRNHPDEDASSGLSPYLHFGHVGAHQVFAAIREREEWTTGDLAEKAHGKREGWWGMSEGAEAFLDELVTWREIGFNHAAREPEADRYESLPEWARETLEAHEDDPRDHVYDLETFAEARTHDPLWNAAQRQLLEEGRIHNYLRMLWGKKILHWTTTPRDALAVMLELNDRYAVDGRDPNSLSGIFWVLGRFDRAWGPERPIFGKVRYMTSKSARSKLRLEDYLARFGGDAP